MKKDIERLFAEALINLLSPTWPLKGRRPKLYVLEDLEALASLDSEQEKHDWQCISPGTHDSTYECQKCKKQFTDQADAGICGPPEDEACPGLTPIEQEPEGVRVVAFGDEVTIRITDDDTLTPVANALVIQYPSAAALRDGVLSFQRPIEPPVPEQTKPGDPGHFGPHDGGIALMEQSEGGDQAAYFIEVDGLRVGPKMAALWRDDSRELTRARGLIEAYLEAEDADYDSFQTRDIEVTHKRNDMRAYMKGLNV